MSAQTTDSNKRLEQYLASLNTFSGADLVVNFHDKVIGEIQQISWSISRAKAPIYSLGSADPRSFSRGNRGIGGSFVLFNFDQDALIRELTEINTWKQIAPPAMFTAKGNIPHGENNGLDFERLLSMTEFGGSIGDIVETVDGSNPDYKVNQPANFDLLGPQTIMYADQLPPFTQ